MSRNEVEQKLGPPESEIGNEYGTKWQVYHQDFSNFVMVSYIDNKVHGLYTNQNMITSKSGVKYGIAKKAVRKELGQPIKGFKKVAPFMKMITMNTIYLIKTGFIRLHFMINMKIIN